MMTRLGNSLVDVQEGSTFGTDISAIPSVTDLPVENSIQEDMISRIRTTNYLRSNPFNNDHTYDFPPVPVIPNSDIAENGHKLDSSNPFNSPISLVKSAVDRVTQSAPRFNQTPNGAGIPGRSLNSSPTGFIARSGDLVGSFGLFPPPSHPPPQENQTGYLGKKMTEEGTPNNVSSDHPVSKASTPFPESTKQIEDINQFNRGPRSLFEHRILTPGVQKSVSSPGQGKTSNRPVVCQK